MRQRRFASLIGAMMLAAADVHAAQEAVFSVQSDLVVLHVSVKDRRGGYVTGLSREAFDVFDEGQRQTISFLADTDTPVTIGLLIDSSSSMLPARELVIAAASAFAGASHPQDEIFALAFNERVRTALPASEPFTSDPLTLRTALERSIRARGRTALYDAILAGLEYAARGSRERRALVVVSDGSDNASGAGAEDVLQKVQASNVMIYTLALRDSAAPGEGDARLLRNLAQVTGGAAFRPTRPLDVAAAFQAIARDIRHTYTIGYVPANPVRDGSFRRLRVDVKAPDGRRLQVRSRGGYLARDER